jgi:hypothetical protein
VNRFQKSQSTVRNSTPSGNETHIFIPIRFHSKVSRPVLELTSPIAQKVSQPCIRRKRAGVCVCVCVCVCETDRLTMSSTEAKYVWSCTFIFPIPLYGIFLKQVQRPLFILIRQFSSTVVGFRGHEFNLGLHDYLSSVTRTELQLSLLKFLDFYVRRHAS